MTDTEELFREIESHRLSALVNVASNFKTFLRALQEQPEVQRLAAAMQSPDIVKAVAERVAALARTESDPELEHPADAALAAYLWLLSDRDDQSARLAASAVSECARVWWARKVAEQILASEQQKLDSGSGPTLRPGTTPVTDGVGRLK
jgi:hypothetical protein